MIEIQVRQHDVPHIRRIVSKRLHLGDGGFLRIETDVVQGSEETGNAFPRFRHVAGANACVNQNEFVARFDQKAVAGEMGFAEPGCLAIEKVAAIGALGAAIDVVDVHGETTQHSHR